LQWLNKKITNKVIIGELIRGDEFDDSDSWNNGLSKDHK
jgi:hypothetical protein